MNDNIKAGADIHAGDGGYSLGTQKKYNEFAKGRNQSMGKMRIRQLAEQANAQYCDLDDASCFKQLGLVEAVVFTPSDLEKFAKLIVRECAEFANEHNEELEGVTLGVGQALKKHFGVEDVGS